MVIYGKLKKSNVLRKLSFYSALSDPDSCALLGQSQNSLYSHRSACRADSISRPSYPVETDVAIWTNIPGRLWRDLDFYLNAAHTLTRPNIRWEFYEEHVAACTGKLRNYNIRARCDRFPAVRIVWQLHCTESRTWALQCIDVKAGSRSQSDDILHVGVAKVTGQTAAQVKASCALSCNRLRGSPLVAHSRKFSPTSFPTLLLEAT